MSEQLRPCKACGKNKFSIIKDASGIFIKCEHCWSSVDHGSKTAEEAIDEWNEVNE